MLIKEKRRSSKSLNEAQFENESALDKDFIEFFRKFINGFKSFIPPAIKLMLKLIYDAVLEVFKVEKKNYAHLFTYLIFNYIISPNTHEIYNILPSKYQTVRDFNRLLRVIL